MTPESAVTPTADVTSPPATSVSTTADSSSAPQGTSAPTEQPAGSVTADVQGAAPSQPDPFADLPSVEELNQQAEQGVKYAKALANLRGVIDPLKQQHEELTQKFSPFEPHLERFEQPDQLATVLNLHDSLTAWAPDADTGQPIPATEQFAESFNSTHRQHADYLTADLLGLMTVDPDTGREVLRSDLFLEGIAQDPQRRATALKILGGVEPSALAPQWQPTEEELSIVRPELQDIYRKLPYEEREELKLASPEFVNRTLEKEKLQQELMERDRRSQESQQRETQARETYINQQATQAADEHVTTQLNSALATFHESVVQQCNFLQPLDSANLPSGMTPEQAAQINAQVTASNKSEAAQITGLVVSLFNPQTKAYVLPLLKEIGAVDDKLLGQLDAAASAFANNARNFGNLTFRQRLSANGNYQPAADVTQMSNAADRALKTMVGYANEVKRRIMEKRSNFFELTATQHNATLNSGGSVRPPLSGTGYNPTTAPANGQLPAGRMSRAEIDRLFG